MFNNLKKLANGQQNKKNRKNKTENSFIPIDKRLWFYKKNGEIGYVYDSPFNEKSKTHCGGLQNVGFDMSKSSKKARDLKGF